MNNRRQRNDIVRRMQRRDDNDERKQRVLDLFFPLGEGQLVTTMPIHRDLTPNVVGLALGYTNVDKQVRIRRSVRVGTLTQQALSDLSFTSTFILQNLPGYTEFTSLFDQYKIEVVVVTITPRITSSNSSTYLPTLNTCIDYDDASTYTLDQMRQSNTYIQTPPGAGQVRFIVPRVAVALYNGVATTGYGSQSAWVDAANPDVLHYGLKIVIDSAGTSGAMPLQVYNIDATYCVAFKNTR